MSEIDFKPTGLSNYAYIAKSEIEGKGIFATECLSKGMIIIAVQIDGFCTEAGRYVKHSNIPNTEIFKSDGNVYLCALQNINKDEEIRVNYRRSEVATIEVRKIMTKMKDQMIPVDGNDFVEHYFSDGIYTRVMYMPAGYIIMGKIHREETMNILVKGTIKIYSEEEKEYRAAPDYFVSGPGIRKAMCMLTDTILVNSHKNPTNTQDLEELERNIIISEHI